jgi:hypothetical protein
MQASRQQFVKATIQEYRQTLTGLPASINLQMSAICKLATGAADNGLLDQAIANGVSRLHGVTSCQIFYPDEVGDEECCAQSPYGRPS